MAWRQQSLYIYWPCSLGTVRSQLHIVEEFYPGHIDGLLQGCSISIVNALAILQYCTKLLICLLLYMWFGNSISDWIAINTFGVHIQLVVSSEYEPIQPHKINDRALNRPRIQELHCHSPNRGNRKIWIRLLLCLVLLWYISPWFNPYNSRVASLALGQSNDCLSASEANLNETTWKNMFY